MCRHRLAAAALGIALSGCNPDKGAHETGKVFLTKAQNEGTMRRANGQTHVTSYEPTPYDVIADGPSLLEVRVDETFTGDIEGEGTVRVIQAARKDGSASFTGIERVRGKVGGRKGSFLLQLEGTVSGKKMNARWFVVPGSGTEELGSLHGQGGFEAQLGQHGTIWLDYAFE